MRTGGGYLLQTRRTLDRIQDHDSRIKDTDAGIGSRLALYDAADRRAMTEHALQHAPRVIRWPQAPRVAR
jgi:hypothetical protein